MVRKVKHWGRGPEEFRYLHPYYVIGIALVAPCVLLLIVFI